MHCARFISIMNMLLFVQHISALQRFFTPIRTMRKYISTISQQTKKTPHFWFPTHNNTVPLKVRLADQLNNQPFIPQISYALHEAAASGNHERVRKLLGSACQREGRKEVDTPNAAGWTPLMLAVAKKH